MLRSTATPQRLLSSLRHQSSRTSFHLPQSSIQRRLASSATGPNKSSSWKSFFVRLGLAGGVVYYYNTASIFQPQPALMPTGPESPDATLPTLESLATQRAKSKSSAPESQTVTESRPPPLGSETPVISDAESLEAEAGQQGAFNPETGEINWDCPCLGGMAHGPCGEEFKAAFSCFVYSEEEPKGMECIDKFKGMQDCFRAHPDVYAAELEDDEEDSEAAQIAQEEAGETASKVKADVKQASETAIEKTKEVGEEAKSKAAEITEKTTEAASAIKDKAQNKLDQASKKAKDTKDKVETKVKAALRKQDDKDTTESISNALSNATEITMETIKGSRK